MKAKPLAALTRPGGRNFLTEIESKRFFENAGLPVVATKLATTREEAVRHGEELGYPLAMKVMSPEVIHKSDAGGVKLGLASSTEVERAYDDILSSVAKVHPSARIEGMAVQSMAPPGREIIIGMSKDPELGPLLMFGLGGVMVEVMKDVSFRLVPLTAADAAEMIRETKGYALLRGFRGSEAVDIRFLEGLLLTVSELVQAHPEIKELDLNPVVVYSTEGLIVDARIILEESE
jgi:acetate---CoA ligase (ADP-forming) subunit beta